MQSSIGTLARWLAGVSSAQRFHHSAQCGRINAGANPQPLARRQNQFQARFRCWLWRISSFHQCEPHRLPIPQPLPPNIKGLFCNFLLLTELLHRKAAALVCRNPLASTLLCSRFSSPCRITLLWSTMRFQTGFREGAFIRRLHSFARASSSWSVTSRPPAGSPNFPPAPFPYGRSPARQPAPCDSPVLALPSQVLRRAHRPWLRRPTAAPAEEAKRPRKWRHGSS